ncbi:hypothetical protein J6590_074211 [Homalodisca vitripennis]|nr:hypothetical protein J6590_074211 [Homalodisca vitripennis]
MTATACVNSARRSGWGKVIPLTADLWVGETSVSQRLSAHCLYHCAATANARHRGSDQHRQEPLHKNLIISLLSTVFKVTSVVLLWDGSRRTTCKDENHALFVHPKDTKDSSGVKAFGESKRRPELTGQIIAEARVRSAANRGLGHVTQQLQQWEIPEVAFPKPTSADICPCVIVYAPGESVTLRVDCPGSHRCYVT